MTYEEILDNARHLPLVERLRLVEEVSRSVRESVADGASIAPELAQREETWQEERRRLLKDEPPESSAHKLFGILRTDAPPPTDEEIKEEYYAYLEKKYS